MIHANPLLCEYGFSGFLLGMTLPEVYFAANISDFLDERCTVKPTSFLRTVGYVLPLRTGGTNFAEEP